MRHLQTLCSVEPDRRLGGPGNDSAVRYVAAQLEDLGWATSLQWFDCLGWHTDGGEIRIDGTTHPVEPAPYGAGVSTRGRLVAAATAEELAAADADGAILLLHGGLTAQPLTPRRYPFYESAEDEAVLRLIEGSAAAAVVAVTGRFPEMCGAVDPFPFIEDGSVDVPAASVGKAIGAALLDQIGRHAEIHLGSRRWPARGANVVARRGRRDRRITVVAHIDTKPGTPGALDNGTGVVTLLRVAEALRDEGFDHGTGIEMLVVNGEDTYSAAGEVRYLAEANLHEVALAINVDGIGLPGGDTAWSLYGCPDELADVLRGQLEQPGLVEGQAWIQSDHAVFAMRGCPALAFTSADLDTALGWVAHAPTDTPDGVDVRSVETTAGAIADVVRALTRELAP